MHNEVNCICELLYIYKKSKLLMHLMQDMSLIKLKILMIIIPMNLIEVPLKNYNHKQLLIMF